MSIESLETVEEDDPDLMETQESDDEDSELDAESHEQYGYCSDEELCSEKEENAVEPSVFETIARFARNKSRERVASMASNAPNHLSTLD